MNPYAGCNAIRNVPTVVWFERKHFDPQEFVDELNYKSMPQMGYMLEVLPEGSFWVWPSTGERYGANKAGRQALADGLVTRFKGPRSHERTEDNHGRGSEGLQGSLAASS